MEVRYRHLERLAVVAMTASRLPTPTPNTRVQRTRSSPSALREPLTRHPLGRPNHPSAAWRVHPGSVGVLEPVRSSGCPERRQTDVGQGRGRERVQAAVLGAWRLSLRGSFLGRGSVAEEAALKMRLPNTRVQRTRSSPSALRSPLTRRPLAGVDIPPA